MHLSFMSADDFILAQQLVGEINEIVFAFLRNQERSKIKASDITHVHLGGKGALKRFTRKFKVFVI